VQVRAGASPNAIKEALEMSGLSPHRLEVEITESTILHDLPSTRQTLRQIRAMGVRISLTILAPDFRASATSTLSRST